MVSIMACSIYLVGFFWSPEKSSKENISRIGVNLIAKNNVLKIRSVTESKKL